MNLTAGAFEARTRTGQTFTVCPLPLPYCQLGFVPFVTLEEKQSFEQRGSLLDVSFNYRLNEVNNLVLHGNRSLQPSGAGTMLVVEALDTSLQHNFDENLLGSVAYLRTQNRYLGAAETPQNGYEQVQMSLSRKLDERSTLEFGVRHADTFAAQSAPRVRANEIYLSYQYLWPESSAAQSH
jgi:hypothetical protein